MTGVETVVGSRRLPDDSSRSVVSPSDEQTPRSGRYEGVRFGLVLGAIASLPLVAILISLWVRGWSPTGDDAVIAVRSFDVFTTRMPLVGQVNLTSGGGQVVYDPGPLQYWALAVPVRLVASGAGALIGATLVEVVALVASLVAVARAAGRATAIVVAAGALIATWSAAPALAHPVWNTFGALIPFVATALCGWAVATGSLRWWAVVVGFASFSIQAHLMFVPGAVAIVVLSPLLGVIARRRSGSDVGIRWAIGGGAVGIVCWSAPILQEMLHRPGNLQLLFGSTVQSKKPGMGLDLALNHLARTIAPNPKWLYSTGRGDVTALQMMVLHGRAVWAVAALMILVAIAVVAALRRDERVLGLAVIVLAVDLTAVWVVAAFPRERSLSLSYASWLFWPSGMLTWLTYGYAAARWTRPTIERLRMTDWAARLNSASRPLLGEGRRQMVLSASVCIVAVAALALSVFAGADVTAWTPHDATAWQSNGAASQHVAEVIARQPDLRRCPIRIATEPMAYSLMAGVTYQLVIRGRHPTPVALVHNLKPYYTPKPGEPSVTLTDTIKRPVDPHTTQLGVVASRDPNGTRHRYVISLALPTPASGHRRNGAAC